MRVAEFEPCMSDAVEAQVLDRFRWWHTEELVSAREPLTPSALADIVARYLTHGAPADVTHVEVLVD